jgi:hypothetical protein
MRARVAVVVCFLAFAAPAHAGGPFMAVGAAEDLAKQQDYAFAKAQMDKAKLAGFDTIRVTQVWTKGQTAVGPIDSISLGNVVKAAQFTGVRLILSLYPFGSSVTPLTDEDRAAFAQLAVDAAKRWPYVHDFIIGNEPNLNRFWLPQFGPNGEDVAAPAYVSLLAVAYDALKAVRPHSTVYGGALAPRGVDKPATGRDTHSPTAFIADMGSYYRSTGRAIPVMDAFAFHPYPENSSTPPDFAHPNSSSLGLADYPKLVQLLGQAFDGTAQKGSTLPILYDEFGVETVPPATKAPFYTGAEPATTKPVDEVTQARFYTQAMAMTFCQPNVIGLLLFHVQDEPALAAWQSGEFYVDGSPKTSLYPVRAAASLVHRGIVARCEGLQLTPKVAVTVGRPTKTGVKVFLTCAIDCAYTASVDGRTLRGTAVGRVTKTLLFAGRLAPGPHQATAQATATVNLGPPGTASRTFRAR